MRLNFLFRYNSSSFHDDSMVLAFLIVLLVLGAAIVLSIYSTFVPFFENLGSITQYNIAYYGSLSSIERALLVIKYQNPGFEGSGGWQGSSMLGPVSDQPVGYFGRLFEQDNGMRWTIRSRTSVIPASGEGNVDYLFASTDSNNFNVLPYYYTETFVLSVDSTNNPASYYTYADENTSFAGSRIRGTLRLPPIVYEGFGGNDSALLCDGDVLGCDPDGDRVHDDRIVQWSFKGVHEGIVPAMPFTILPWNKVFYTQATEDPAVVDLLRDTSIRESTINSYMNNPSLHNIDFTSSKNPINSSSPTPDEQIVIAAEPDLIIGMSFQELFGNGSISGLKLDIGLVDFLRSTNGNIYPFLEYRFEFDEEQVSDRFYTIHSSSRVGLYQIQIRVRKPTVVSPLVGDFVIIF